MAIYGSVTPQSDNVNGGINNQKEETIAGYFMLDFAHDSLFGTDVPIDGNIGVRVVNSKDTVSAGWLTLPVFSTNCISPPATSCADYTAAQTSPVQAGEMPLARSRTTIRMSCRA